MSLCRHAVIKGMAAVNSKFNFQLTQGYSAETSGGLLIMIPADKADGFVKEISEIDGHPAWIVGRVVEGELLASMLPAGLS